MRPAYAPVATTRTLDLATRGGRGRGTLVRMRLVGDPDGIAALKTLVAQHREYIKFLLAEAGTNTDHAASFRGPDGSLWQIVHRPLTGEIEVRRAP